MNLAYVRVSSKDQNEARQLEALEKYNIDKWYTEKISGKDANRPKLKEMLDFCREGDVVYIHEFSRLARNTKDLLTIVEYLDKKGVALVSNKDNIDTGSPVGKFMLTVLGAIAELERSNIRERQLEGIAIAKANGAYKGRTKIKLNENLFNANYELYMKRAFTKREFAERMNVSIPTLNKWIKNLK